MSEGSQGGVCEVAVRLCWASVLVGIANQPAWANREASCIPELQNASECAFYCVGRHSVYASGGCVPTLRGQQRNPLVYSLQIFHHQVRCIAASSQNPNARESHAAAASKWNRSVVQILRRHRFSVRVSMSEYNRFSSFRALVLLLSGLFGER
jgi:hypothetical protein